ncbi:ABC transporter ATP-binding protein [Clavibacter michiganensis]|uniref:ABC transporter ATP-binding protein n=1 Tax=Clavibacter michiganensis TaxID=28447 RepID=UPI000CE73BF2|nr:ABC transporter ATP-binding protein [Clavibacter michiganensis]PPF91352.1 ABC transporter ATP-binding protein [Clavibacter michiganensis]PPF99393.1 ABC transporter ATP-binding protein [Clavibacter michiganensis]
MNTPLLRAERLVLRYGKNPALDGVDLVIREGESVAIMGASGSGKTSLLHCLSGVLRPDSGRVVFSGPSGAIDIDKLSDGKRSTLRRQDFGFVFQQGLLVPELTAVENAALPLLLSGADRAQAEAHATSWLVALGLAGMEQRRIGEMSGGQAQRVAIARSQVTGAALTFADEPTGALDSATGVGVMDALLQATVGQGRTLTVVTHDESVAARCSRVVRLVDGHIVSDSALDDSAKPPTTSVPKLFPRHAQAAPDDLDREGQA